jgi:hypothetical protein
MSKEGKSTGARPGVTQIERNWSSRERGERTAQLGSSRARGGRGWGWGVERGDGE